MRKQIKTLTATGVNIIEQCNFHHTGRICFYGYYNANMVDPTLHTVALFKIKYKPRERRNNCENTTP